jgi:hypothetical protein
MLNCHMPLKLQSSNGKHSMTYCGNFIYEDSSLKRILLTSSLFSAIK